MRVIAVAALLTATQVMAATAEDAKKFVAELDTAVKAADSAIQSGTLKAFHDQSKRMNALKESGKQFGSSVFDTPFGYCFGSGIQAQSWWFNKMNASREGGEKIPGSIDFAWKQYQDHRKACLEAATGGGKESETVQIKATSEKPPYAGCLKVFGVRDDGKVGTVAYTCPKK